MVTRPASTKSSDRRTSFPIVFVIRLSRASSRKSERETRVHLRIHCRSPLAPSPSLHTSVLSLQHAYLICQISFFVFLPLRCCLSVETKNYPLIPIAKRLSIAPRFLYTHFGN